MATYTISLTEARPLINLFEKSAGVPFSTFAETMLYTCAVASTSIVEATDKDDGIVDENDDMFFKASGAVLTPGWYLYTVSLFEKYAVEISSNSVAVSKITITGGIALPSLCSDQYSRRYFYLSSGFATSAEAEAATSSSTKYYSNYRTTGDLGWDDHIDNDFIASTSLGYNLGGTLGSSEGNIELIGARIFTNADEDTFSVKITDTFSGGNQWYLATIDPSTTLTDNFQNKILYIDNAGIARNIYDTLPNI